VKGVYLSEPRKIDNGNKLGWLRGVADHFILVWRLWKDPRISPLLKLLPLGSLVYLVSPFDLPTPIDDAGVIWFFTYLFIESCPPEIVAEHRAQITGTVDGRWQDSSSGRDIDEADVVDAEFRQKTP
jgi:hypothetical protein